MYVLGQWHTGDHREEAWTAFRAQFIAHLCELRLLSLNPVACLAEKCAYVIMQRCLGTQHTLPMEACSHACIHLQPFDC